MEIFVGLIVIGFSISLMARILRLSFGDLPKDTSPRVYALEACGEGALIVWGSYLLRYS